jgi:anti-sigma B factor antagonist/stage II sporulation protein AA (anti-sigma F factor antagonist)
MELADVEVVHQADTPIVRIRGEIDLSNTDAIRTEVIEALRPSAPGVVLDLTETTYLDSSGVRLLFDLAARLQSRRQRLGLVVTEAALVRRVLILTKLDDAVPLHDSVDDALAAITDG